MVITIFKHRVRPGVGKEYAQAALPLLAIAQKMPGFVSVKNYAAQDGELLTLVEFESEQALAAWRNHPQHLEAQKRGRNEFYVEYTIQVCKTLRAYDFKAPTAG
jgi:heme-degrading monooxygenase HmoA